MSQWSPASVPQDEIPVKQPTIHGVTHSLCFILGSGSQLPSQPQKTRKGPTEAENIMLLPPSSKACTALMAIHSDGDVMWSV